MLCNIQNVNVTVIITYTKPVFKQMVIIFKKKKKGGGESLFRDGMPSLSSSYKISGLVPVCWLLFQCFVLKPAKLPKRIYLCPGVFLRDEQLN